MKTMTKTRKTFFALLSVSLAMVLALSALAFTMNGTGAALEDTPVTLICESGIPSLYTIEVGQTSSSTVLNLNEAYSGDASLATLYSTGGTLNNMQITGKKAGVATVAFGTRNGVLSVVRYQITDSANISAYLVKDGGTIQFGEPGESKPVPVEVVTGTDNIRWNSLNETVVSFNEATGLVNAEKRGVTILIGEFTDKWGVERDIHILVGVGVSLDGLNCCPGGDGKPGDGEEPEKPITATGPGSLVDGRMLDDNQTGDGKWVEIARNGDYSLIVRKEFIKCYKDDSKTDYWTWYAPDASDNNYTDPNNFLRRELNYWFNAAVNSNADGRQYLAKDARLREYTVTNSAYNVPGSSGFNPDSMSDGFSKPFAYRTGAGNDIAFALSWSEAASFCSVSARYRDNTRNQVNSDPIAVANYEKLENLKMIYLRSKGDAPGMMGTISEGNSFLHGEVFQSAKAFIHPALWVHQDIFKNL